MPGYCRYKEIIDQVYGVDELVIDKQYIHAYKITDSEA